MPVAHQQHSDSILIDLTLGVFRDYTPDERRDLAKKSQAAPPSFGSEQRHALMQDLHQRMLDALVQVKMHCFVMEEQGCVPEAELILLANL